MSFINPGILFGLAAAAVPLLIHLLTRTKRRIIPFSTLRFLKEIQYQQSRRLRLRQILLLILRTLIVILLVLAFARPTLHRRPTAASGTAHTAAVLIIDNSFSMNRYHNGRLLFEEAKEKALAVLKTFETGDRLYILTSTDTTAEWSRLAFFPDQFAEQKISAIKINYGRTNLTAALQAAVQRLQELPELNKEIYLFSDLQKSGFAETFAAPPGFRVYAAACSVPSTANLAVSEVAVKSLLQRGRTAEVEVLLANTGDQPLNESVVRLFVDDKAAAQTAVSTAPGSVTMETLRFTVEHTGFSILRIETEDDDLAEDNQRLAGVWVPDSLRIGIAATDPEQTFYLQAALNADEMQRNLFRLQNIGNAERYDFRPFDAVILLDPVYLAESTVVELQKFVSSGGGLLLILGRSLDHPRFNSETAPRFGLPPIREAVSAGLSQSAEFTLGRIDLEHPLFKGVFTDDTPQFTPPRFRFAWRVRPVGVDPILTYSSGEPFLLEKKLDNGRILVMTSSLESRLTDLPRKTIFAPLITAAVFHAAASKVFLPQSAVIDQELRYQAGIRPASTVFEMRRPDDLYDRLTPRLETGGAVLVYAQTDLPGLYRLYADRSMQHQWAVNVPVEESILESISPDELEKRFGIKTIPPNADFASFIAAQRRGIELWKWFAVSALLLLLAEMILYREKGETVVEPMGETKHA